MAARTSGPGDAAPGTHGPTIVGIFTDRSQAEQAIQELKAAGFTEEQVGVAMLDRQEQQQLIEDAFSRMEASDVSALLLCDHFGFSLQEVAQILDCSYAAAAKRVGRARNRFARHYRELSGEGAPQ